MQLTDQNFNQEVENNKLVLVDFFAVWCGPCKAMEPIIHDLEEKYKGTEGVKIAQINIDENPAIAEKYGIMSIPTIMLFKNGNEIEKMVGLQDKGSLEALIEKHLNN